MLPLKKQVLNSESVAKEAKHHLCGKSGVYNYFCSLQYCCDFWESEWRLQKILIGPTVSSWETACIDFIFDNNTTVSLKKADSICINLIIGSTKSSQEMACIYCTFDNNTVIPLEKVYETCKKF